MSKKSLRVYFVRHREGHLTGFLLRTWDWVFDRRPPSAFGSSEDAVLDQLEVALHAMAATRDDTIERYLWDETFQIQRITVLVHPETRVKKRTVIGKREIPLHLTYLWSRVPGGGFRVLVPRFGWSVLVEDLGVAASVLEHAVSAAMIGEEPRSLYDFRAEEEEFVRAWSPRIQESREAWKRDEDDDRPTLRAVSDDLVDRAARGKLPPVFGESAELDAAMPAIERDPPASILLVGGSGIGKTAWVHRLARRLVALRREKVRRRAPRLFGTSADRILAGMAYLGMWQERCIALVRELSGEGDYLYAGSLPALIRSQPDGTSIADMLLSAVQGGEISVIAECTDAELDACSRRAPALVSTFHVVRIAEPSAAAVPLLLVEYEARKDPRVRLHPAGKKRLVSHLAMFRPDQRFPGKALRFYDWLAQEAEGEGRAPDARPRVLYPRDVSEAYARWSGLPIELIADEVPTGAPGLALRLGERVIGQARACETAARVLSRFKAGLNDPERPCGTLLFIGPTGVGKTELAKQLARVMFGHEDRMIRLDMSEYMGPGAASRLLEAGPGSSSLAQRVRQEPLSLVLLDEIEKADSEVFDVLLGILGEGRLTDEDGRLVDFRMTLIVMTSNLGASDARPVGFGDDASPAGSNAMSRVREHFRPELVNRIDHVIPFRNLDRADVLSIVDLVLDEARARTGLVRRNLRLTATPAAKAKLGELGYHPTWGARPLKRVVEERVISPVAARIAADPALRDREIVVGVDAEGRLVVG